jgi:hypothetical protein
MMAKSSVSGPLYVGGSLVGGPQTLTTSGNAWFIDPVNGSNGNTGDSMDQAFKTLEVAYSRCINNHNDVVYILASGTNAEGVSGGTALTLDAAFTWSKNFTHLVGLTPPTVVSQRARINQLSTKTGVTTLFTVSGNNCIFKNLQIAQGVADATSLVAVTVSGERNVFENVHFAGVGHATMSAAGAASLKLDGGDENRFVGCTFGVDTVVADADATNVILDNQAARNTFEDCMFQAYISAAGFANVVVADITGVDRWTIFKRCLFLTESATNAVAQTSVFTTVGSQTGRIILLDSVALTDGGAADWDSGNNSVVWNNQVAAAASAAGGVMTKQ